MLNILSRYIPHDERIINQTIPAAVVNNPNLDWNPFTNAVKPAAVKDGEAPGKTAVASDAPEPNTRLLDRLLVACHHAEIHPIICINKIDKGLGEIEEWLPGYRGAGYQVLLVSARTARSIGSLTRAVHGHTTLFCGQSGVGKSALLNAIHPGYRLREGSISEATGKGRHTTSTAQLLPLPDDGFVVDTPELQ